MPLSWGARTLLGLIVFLTVIAFVIFRPRGLNEAWPPVGGAGALLALGFLVPRDLVGAARETAGVLRFLLGMMVLSAALEMAGVFSWAASYAVRTSGGSSRRLLINVFLLGAIVTALLSLDVTVIILTPLVYATVVALEIDPLPYLYACTFVANTGSLVFPMSNLTNLLVADRLGLPFWRFSLAMIVPNIIAVATNAGVFLWLFRDRLPRRLPVARSAVASVETHTRFFRVSVALFGLVLAGLFLTGLADRPLWPIALAAGAAVTVVTRVAGRDLRLIARGVSWPLFPFVWGMAAIVRGVEHAGLTAGLARLVLGHAGTTAGAVVTTGAVSAIGANVFNNIPMTLLMLTVLAGAPAPGSGSSPPRCWSA